MRYIFIFLSLCLAGGISTVSAADYSVSPLLIEHDIEPRDMFEETVKISNTTDRPLRLYPTVNEITLGYDGEIKTFVPASMSGTATSVTSWIAVTRGRQEIAPGETIKIQITVKISPNATPGEYYGFIGFAEGDNRDKAELLVTEGRAPGVVVRFSLKEKRNEYLRLEKFNIPRFIISGNDSQITFDINNVGSVPLTPAGEIIFYDSSGQELTALKVNPEQITVPPETIKSFTASVPELGLIGRRKAFINIEYGTKERANVYDTLYFNVIPLGLLLILFIATLIISIVVSILIHRRRQKLSFLNEQEDVPVYIRTGNNGAEKDHDINLKK